MIVEVIHVDYVTLFEPKGHALIPGHHKGIVALHFAF